MHIPLVPEMSGVCKYKSCARHEIRVCFMKKNTKTFVPFNGRLFFILLLGVVAVTAFPSCGNDYELKGIVESMSSECPTPIGEWATFENVEYDGNTVCMTMKISDDILDIDNIKANEMVFRQNALNSFANNPNDIFRKVIDAIVKADANLDIVYKNEFGDSYTLHFTAEELAGAQPENGPDPEMLLKASVDNAKLNVPQYVDEVTILTDMTIEQGYVFYVYECDESMVDMDELAENSELLKSSIVETMKSNDPLIVSFVQQVKDTHRGIASKYVGSTSGKSFVVYLEPDEL